MIKNLMWPQEDDPVWLTFPEQPDIAPIPSWTHRPKYVNRRPWRYLWTGADGKRYRFRANSGLLVDGVSSPSLMRIFPTFLPDSLARGAALMHDSMYGSAGIEVKNLWSYEVWLEKAGWVPCGKVDQATADRLFLQCCRESGVGIERRLFWRALRVAGWNQWGKKPQAIHQSELVKNNV